jgi:hypothetical protein
VLGNFGEGILGGPQAVDGGPEFRVEIHFDAVQGPPATVARRGMRVALAGLGHRGQFGEPFLQARVSAA